MPTKKCFPLWYKDLSKQSWCFWCNSSPPSPSQFSCQHLEQRLFPLLMMYKTRARTRYHYWGFLWAVWRLNGLRLRQNAQDEGTCPVLLPDSWALWNKPLSSACSHFWWNKLPSEGALRCSCWEESLKTILFRSHGECLWLSFLATSEMYDFRGWNPES